MTLRTLLIIWCAFERPISIQARSADSFSEAGSFSEGYNVRQWTTADGLPSSRVHCLFQSEDGYLWIGTQRGLARFDGVQFRLFPEVRAHCISASREGAIWLGDNVGTLYRIHQGEVTRHDPPRTDGFPVAAMYPRNDGGVWALIAGQVVQAERGSVLGKLDFAQARGITEDASGFLWITGGTNLHRVDPRTAELQVIAGDQEIGRIPDWLPSESLCVLVDSSGRIWEGGRFGMRVKRGGKRTYAKRNDHPLPPTISAIASDATGTIWGGGVHGLFRARETQLELINLPGTERTSAFAAAADGGIWVGTEDAGVFLLTPKPVRMLTKDTGLASDDVWSIMQARDGSMWIACYGGVTHLTTDGKSRHYGPESGLVSPRTFSVAEDAEGRIWAATRSVTGAGSGNGTVSLLVNGQFVIPSPDTAIPGDYTSLIPDRDGSVWILGHNRLQLWRDGRFNPIKQPDDFQASLGFLARNGDLWLSHSRLWRKRRDEFLPIPDGLKPGLRAVVHEDEHGALWLASENSGTVRYKNGEFKEVTTKSGLACDLTLSLLEDDFGRYWFNSHSGIFAARKSDLNDVADGRRATLSCIRLGLEDGMLSVEGNGGNLPNSCKTRDGQLWFPTIHGVAIVDPKIVAPLERPPKITIEEAYADGELVFSNTPDFVGEDREIVAKKTEPVLRLAPGRGRRLSVSYTANCFEDIDKVRFRYRLAERGPEWIEAGLQRTQRFDDLPPGEHRFEVIACNAHGVWNSLPATLRFYIPPRYYQTASFYIFTAAAVFGAVGAFWSYRSRVQRRIARLEQAAALARERERIARDLHDDLGASLTKIALLSKAAPPPEGGGLTSGRISELAQSAIEGMGELIWSTNPKYDDLESLLGYLREYANECFSSSQFDVRFDAPTEIPAVHLSAEFRRQVLLVFKEVLRNIQKHSRASTVRISATIGSNASNRKEYFLRLAIEDDGVGFDPSEIPRFHHGLENMRQRIATLHGTFDLQSRPGKGTLLILTVPLSG